MKGNFAEMTTDIESRINEAEVCRSMGLYGDSLNIYEDILSFVDSDDSQTQDKIKGRISSLKKEIADQEQTEPPGVSVKELSMFKQTFSSQGDVSAILDSASAFQEMGLHNEAMAEYAKLIPLDYPLENIRFSEAIYEFSEKALIDVVKQIDGAVNYAMVVGHNPAINGLANYIGDQPISNIPTCGVFCVELDISSWANIKAHCGKLKFFEYPKKHRS